MKREKLVRMVGLALAALMVLTMVAAPLLSLL